MSADYHTDDLPKPPFCLEAEQALLGAILVNNEALRNVEHILDAEHFHEPLHGRIYSTCLDLVSRGQRISPIILKPFFEGENVTDDLPVWKYLGRLCTQAVTVINAPSYAVTILDLSRRRELISAARDFASNICDASSPLKDICGEFISELDGAISGKFEQRGRASIGQASADVLDVLQSPDSPKGITTGLADLDHVLGGYYPGELVIVAARPGMGKSTFAPSTLLRTSRSAGVLYISLEMTRDALAQRCLSDLSWNSVNPIAYIDIRRKTVSEFQIEQLRRAHNTLQTLPFVIDDSPGLTVAEIAARSRAVAQRFERKGHKLSVICIDHLGKIRASNRYAGNKVQETGETSNALASLAKELDCTVIALSQLSRAVESQERKNKRPILADLRNSGDIEQDADVVMFLYRKAYYLEQVKFDDDEKERERRELLDASQHDLEIIVAKQRSGPCRTVLAYCDMVSNVVRDRA